jgi:hypothetical protein
MSSVKSNKCCKVCRDAGKPDTVVTSHYVKDTKNGVIVCPTLLATVCRYCKQNGHTVKYCNSIKNKSRVSGATNFNTHNHNELTVKKAALEVNTRVNRYESLSDDSDDEEVTPVVPIPVLERHAAATIPKRWIDYDSDSDIEQEI